MARIIRRFRESALPKVAPGTYQGKKMMKGIKKFGLAAMIVASLFSVSCIKETDNSNDNNSNSGVEQTPASLVGTRWETGHAGGSMAFALNFLTQSDVAIIDCHYDYEEYREIVEGTSTYKYVAPNGRISKPGSDNMEYWTFIVNGNTLTLYAEDVFGGPMAFNRK